MASKAATLGDPRRPQEVKKVGSLQLAAADEGMCQTMLIAAMGAGLSAMLLQSKALIWASLFVTMAAYTHMPFDAPNSMQLLVFVLTMVGWSVLQVYFKPFLTPNMRQPGPAPAAAVED